MTSDEIQELFARNTSAFLKTVNAFLKSEPLRDRFKADPSGTLEHLGFKFKDAAQAAVIADSIRAIQTIPDPGGDVMNVAVGVAAGTSPAVDVGTQPLTAPVVSVVVQVASQGEVGTDFVNPDPEKLFEVDELRLVDQVRIADLEAQVESLKKKIEELGGAAHSH